jgi:hypothetical protein
MEDLSANDHEVYIHRIFMTNVSVTCNHDLLQQIVAILIIIQFHVIQPFVGDIWEFSDEQLQNGARKNI